VRGMGNAGAMMSTAPPRVDRLLHRTPFQACRSSPRPGSGRCRWRSQLCTLGAAREARNFEPVPTPDTLGTTERCWTARDASGRETRIRVQNHLAEETLCTGTAWSFRLKWMGPAPGHRGRCPVAASFTVDNPASTCGSILMVTFDRAPGGDGTGRIADRRGPAAAGSVTRHLGRRRLALVFQDTAFTASGQIDLHAEAPPIA